ncbi:MAG TPA: class I SAM-dependent methyltransferase [Ilumatobacteraceae bacterium]|nr:class I SAM-dependent methyltransferase [Ilumatobacteraceae bacterium]
MLARSLSTAVQRLEFSTKRAISGVVSSASTAYYGRWYYSNRWHPHHALLQRALDETADYITSNMSDAMVKRDDIEVLNDALLHATSDGLHFEFGVRSGRSINHIARRRPNVTVHGFDSFEGLPEPWTGWTVDRGGFGGEGIPNVEPNVELHVGWFDDTLDPFLTEHPGDVSFVHIDSDIYSSARTILQGLAPRMRPGSIIVFNEYFNYPNWKQHEFRAFQEFCEEYHVTYDYLCWGMYEVAVEITSIGTDPAAPEVGR